MVPRMQSNKFKIGLFVVFSLVVFLVAISALGMFDALRAKAQLMTMVEESVQGLSSGSSVKYRGVPIGKVTDITINTAGKRIRVDMQIDLSKFKTENSPDHTVIDISKEEFYRYILKDIESGLRCQIEPDGITGMKYIELDFAKNPETRFFMDPGYDAEAGVFYIPSVPSLFSDLRTSMTNIIAKLESIDYKGISDKTLSTLDSADRLFNNPAFVNSIRNIDEASAGLVVTLNSLNASFTRERMDSLIGNADKAILSIRRLTDTATQTIDDAALAETVRSFRSSMDVFRQSNRSFTEAMLKFNEGLDAMIELIQYMEADPSSLLRGKNKPAGNGTMSSEAP